MAVDGLLDRDKGIYQRVGTCEGRKDGEYRGGEGLHVFLEEFVGIRGDGLSACGETGERDYVCCRKVG